MACLLDQLGLPENILRFFMPYVDTGDHTSLQFYYNKDQEHYSPYFHRVPLTEHLWMAGDDNFACIRQVIIAASAMDAMAFFTLNHHRLGPPDNLLFIAVGLRPVLSQINWIKKELGKKEVILIFGNDSLGKITDIKTAMGMRSMPVAVNYVAEARFRICFRMKEYFFGEDQLSLHAFEKAVGICSRVRTIKPKENVTWLDQWQAKSINGTAGCAYTG